MIEEIPQSVIDAIRKDIQKEMSKRMAGWAVAGGAGLVVLAGLGAWGLLKPTIAFELGVVPKAEINGFVDQKISNFVTYDDLDAATSVFRTEEQVRNLIEANNAQTGIVTETRVRALVSEALAPYQPFKDMKGAVIAFDRSEDRGGGMVGGACPIGWTLFREAGGRVIIGAGAHENTDETGQQISDYRAFSDDEDDATGGAETVTLIEKHIPPHTHDVQDEGHRHNVERDEIYGGAGGRLTQEIRGNRVDSPYASAENKARISEDSFGGLNGKTQPHDNMPPYIAIYFCKKES